MTRATAVLLAFATGFATAIAGAWWTLELIIRFLYRKGQIR